MTPLVSAAAGGIGLRRRRRRCRGDVALVSRDGGQSWWSLVSRARRAVALMSDIRSASRQTTYIAPPAETFNFRVVTKSPPR